MRTKNKIIVLLSLLIVSSYSYGQIRIANNANNSSAANSSAFIDASSNTTYNTSSNVGKGLLFPRVDLSTFTAFSYSGAFIPNNYPNRFDGFIVYNTAESGVAGVANTEGTLTPGFWYYENKTTNITGGTWKPFVSQFDATTLNETDPAAWHILGNTIDGDATTSPNFIGTINERPIIFKTDNTEKMRLTPGGFLGIGTDTPYTKLHIYGDSEESGLSNDVRLEAAEGAAWVIFARHNGTSTARTNVVAGDDLGGIGFVGRYSGLDASVETPQTSRISAAYRGYSNDRHKSDLLFRTSGLSRVRIQEDGHFDIANSENDLYNNASNFYVGNRPASGLRIQNDGRIMCQHDGGNPNLYLTKNSVGGSYGTFLMIRYGGNQIGSIVSSGTSNVVYNTTSDRRLKENIVPTHYGISDLMKLEVKDYNFIIDEDKNKQAGFIAQNLYEVYPEAVTVGGDDPKENPWSVDYGRITPLLVKAVQEQQVIIETQQQLIEALEKRLEELEKK